MRTHQHQHRFPQATRSLLARIPLMYWQALPCALPVSASGTAHSLWIPGRVASGAPPSSSPVCSGSVSSKPESIGDTAALARSVSSGACPPHTSHDFISDFPFSVCVKSGASPMHFSTSAWTCLLATTPNTPNTLPTTRPTTHPTTHNKHNQQHNTKMDWPKMDWPKMDWPKMDWPQMAKPLTTNH